MTGAVTQRPPGGLVPGEMRLTRTRSQSCIPNTPNIWGIQTPWAGLWWSLSRGTTKQEQLPKGVLLWSPAMFSLKNPFFFSSPSSPSAS